MPAYNPHLAYKPHLGCADDINDIFHHDINSKNNGEQTKTIFFHVFMGCEICIFIYCESVHCFFSFHKFCLSLHSTERVSSYSLTGNVACQLTIGVAGCSVAGGCIGQFLNLLTVPVSIGL